MLTFFQHHLDTDHAQIAELMERDLNIEPEGEARRLPPNNARQQEAIDKALGNSFTLIQGPPGNYCRNNETNCGVPNRINC